MVHHSSRLFIFSTTRAADLAVVVTAASLALADAGIEMLDLVAATSLVCRAEQSHPATLESYHTLVLFYQSLASGQCALHLCFLRSISILPALCTL